MSSEWGSFFPKKVVWQRTAAASAAATTVEDGERHRREPADGSRSPLAGTPFKGTGSTPKGSVFSTIYNLVPAWRGTEYTIPTSCAVGGDAEDGRGGRRDSLGSRLDGGAEEEDPDCSTSCSSDPSMNSSSSSWNGGHEPPAGAYSGSGPISRSRAAECNREHQEKEVALQGEESTQDVPDFMDVDEMDEEKEDESTALSLLVGYWMDVCHFFSEVLVDEREESALTAELSFVEDKLQAMYRLLRAERHRIRVEVVEEEEEEVEEEKDNEGHKVHTTQKEGGEEDKRVEKGATHQTSNAPCPPPLSLLLDESSSLPSFPSSCVTSPRGRHRRPLGEPQGGGWVCIQDDIYVYLPPCYYYLFAVPSPLTSSISSPTSQVTEEEEGTSLHSEVYPPVGKTFLLWICQWAKHNYPYGARHMLLRFLSQLLYAADFPSLLLPSPPHNPPALMVYHQDADEHHLHEEPPADPERLADAMDHEFALVFHEPDRNLYGKPAVKGIREDMEGMKEETTPPRFCFSILHVSPTYFVTPLLDIIRQISIALDPGGMGKGGTSKAGRAAVVANAASSTASGSLSFGDKERSAFVRLLCILAEKIERIPELANFFMTFSSNSSSTVLSSPSSSVVSSSTDFVLLRSLLPYLVHDSRCPEWVDRRDTCLLALSAVLSLAKCPEPYVRDVVGGEERVITTTLQAASTTLMTLCTVPENDDSQSEMLFLADVIQYWSALLLSAPYVAESLHLLEHVEKEFTKGTVLPLLQSTDPHVYGAACLVLASLLRQLGGSCSLVLSRILTSILFPVPGTMAKPSHVDPHCCPPSRSTTGPSFLESTTEASSSDREQMERMGRKHTENVSSPSATMPTRMGSDLPSTASPPVHSVGARSSSAVLKDDKGKHRTHVGPSDGREGHQQGLSSEDLPVSVFEKYVVPHLTVASAASFFSKSRVGGASGTGSTPSSTIASHTFTDWTSCEATLVLLEALATYFPALCLEGALGVSLCVPPSSFAFISSFAQPNGLIALDAFVPIILQSPSYWRRIEHRVAEVKGGAMSPVSSSSSLMRLRRERKTSATASGGGGPSTSSATASPGKEIEAVPAVGGETVKARNANVARRSLPPPLDRTAGVTSKSALSSSVERSYGEENAVDRVLSLFFSVIRNEMMTKMLFIESNVPAEILRCHRSSFRAPLSYGSAQETKVEAKSDALEITSSSAKGPAPQAPLALPNPSLSHQQQYHRMSMTSMRSEEAEGCFHMGVHSSSVIIFLSQLLSCYHFLPPSLCVLVSSTITALCLLPDPRVLFTLLDEEKGHVKSALRHVCDQLDAEMNKEVLMAIAQHGRQDGIGTAIAASVSPSSVEQPKKLGWGARAGIFGPRSGKSSSSSTADANKAQAKLSSHHTTTITRVALFQSYYQPWYYLYECGLSEHRTSRSGDESSQGMAESFAAGAARHGPMSGSSPAGVSGDRVGGTRGTSDSVWTGPLKKGSTGSRLEHISATSFIRSLTPRRKSSPPVFSLLPLQRPDYLSPKEYAALLENQSFFETISCLERFLYELEEAVHLVCLSSALLQLQ